MNHFSCYSHTVVLDSNVESYCRMYSLFVFLFMALPCLINGACPLSQTDTHHWCRDENGVRVDWWILYKPPGRDHYVYRTSVTPSSNGNRLLHIKAPHESHMGCTTLRLISTPNSPPEYYSFNDMGDSEDQPIQGYGLGNGLLVRGNMSGYWISHTMPGLQFKHGVTFDIPASATQHGHSAVCISLPYPSDMSDVYKNRLCHMKSRANQNNAIPCNEIPRDVYLDLAHVTKQERYFFMTNAHNPNPAHTKDIYQRFHEVLKSSSPTLVQAGMSTSRIPSGGGIGNSNCTHFVMEGKRGTGRQTLDKSKIAWHQSSNAYLFGDTARTQAQKGRGGGGIAFILPGSPFVELNTANCPA